MEIGVYTGHYFETSRWLSHAWHMGQDVISEAA